MAEVISTKWIANSGTEEYYTTTQFKDTASSHSLISSENLGMNEIYVTVSNGYNSFMIPWLYFNREYSSKIKESIAPLLNQVLTNLLKNRDFLGIQLNYEYGNITEQELSALVKQYLSSQVTYKTEILKRNIELLSYLSDKAFDSEELSIMFNCDINQAEEALDLLINS